MFNLFAWHNHILGEAVSRGQASPQWRIIGLENSAICITVCHFLQSRQRRQGYIQGGRFAWLIVIAVSIETVLCLWVRPSCGGADITRKPWSSERGGPKNEYHKTHSNCWNRCSELAALWHRGEPLASPRSLGGWVTVDLIKEEQIAANTCKTGWHWSSPSHWGLAVWLWRIACMLFIVLWLPLPISFIFNVSSLIMCANSTLKFSLLFWRFSQLLPWHNF